MMHRQPVHATSQGLNRRAVMRTGGVMLGAVALLAGSSHAVGKQSPDIGAPGVDPETGAGLLGVAGGGSIATEAGNTDFSLMAVNIIIGSDDGDATEPIPFGQVKWWAPDATGQPLLMESLLVEEYGPMPENESGRVIRGLMSVNGEGEYPFVVQAIDGEAAGDSGDFVTIQVGDAVEGTTGSGFSYVAEGSLVSGDIQLLTYEPEGEGDTPTT